MEVSVGPVLVCALDAKEEGDVLKAKLYAALSVLLALVGGVSDSLPLTPTGLLSATGIGFLLLITLQLSISLSGHVEAIRELSEANALLEERLARVEQREREREREPEPDA